MFLELNYVQYYDAGGTEILKTILNTTQISFVHSQSNGVVIKMVNGDSFFAVESYEEIKQKLQA